MNVLHFGSYYYPDRGGNVVRMVNMLENNHCGNTLFVLTTSPSRDFDDEAYFSRTGIRIIRIESLEDAKSFLPEVVKQYNINIVVTHIIPANIIACSVLPKKTIIMTEIHSLITSNWIKMLGKDILHRFVLNKRTSCYFVLSRGAEIYIQKHYGVKRDKTCFLPNGVTSFNAQERTPGNPDYFTFGYIGTFYQWQGTEVILDNAEKLLSIGPNVRLYMIGGGEKEDEFKALQKKYPGRIVATGLIPKEEADKLSREIDVLMIPRPSTLESNTAIPLKIFEAIQYGKPVILSDVYGLTEVLSEQEAFIYKNSSKDGLFHMCEYIYANPEEMNKRYTCAVAKIVNWPKWDEIHLRQNEVFQKYMYE